MRIRIDPAVVRASFARFAENPSLRERAQLFAAGKPVVEMIQALAMNAGVLRAFSGFAEVYPCGTLERAVVEAGRQEGRRISGCRTTMPGSG